MASLKEIIHHLAAEFSIYIEANSGENHQIENVQYLISGTAASLLITEQTLYVGEYEEFSRLTTTPGIFLLLNTPAGTSPLPNALYLYHDYNPQELINSIQNLLFQNRHTNLTKEEMFHVLQSGYGMQTILDHAQRVLKNPLTLCTTSFSRIAVSPKDYIYSSFSKYNGKYYVNKKALNHMRENGTIEKLFRSTTPIVTGFDDDPGIAYVFCSVRINRACVGYLCLRCCEQPYSDNDLTLLSFVAKIISIEMQKDSVFTHHAGVACDYFLRDLLEQGFAETDFALHQMEQLGRPAHSYFWVLAFTFIDRTGKNMNHKYYTEQLMVLFPHSICFSYKENIIMLHTSDHMTVFEGIDHPKFQNFMHLNHMLAAVSYRFEQLLDAPVYYRQALYLIENGGCPTGDYCITYDANFRNHLFHLVPDLRDLSAMIHPDILTLKKHDDAYRTGYLETLSTYLKHGRNAQKTSQYLHIHKSTFFYRIGKMQNLTALDLDDSALLLNYEISLAIMEYLTRSKD